MARRNQTALLPLLRRYFEIHLKVEQGASPHTLRAYRDAWRLFIRYLTDVAGAGRAADLKLEDVERRRILDFLRYLEETRRVSVRTRNHRLAVFRAFALFVVGEHPQMEEHFIRVLRIPQKRYRRQLIDYLEPDELHGLLSQVRKGSENALRDFTLLVYAYNTGARAEEIAQTRLQWLQLEQKPFQVRLWGKGRKERLVPLWPATVNLLRKYLAEERKRPSAGADSFFFLNRRGRPLTRFGVAKLFLRYLSRVRKLMPSLKRKRLSIHSMRHTTAVHLLQSGCELNAIKAWLGHASIASTEIYTEINLDTKRSVLEHLVTPHYLTQFLEEQGPDPDSSMDWLDRL